MNWRVSIAAVAALCACGQVLRASERRSAELAAQAAAAIRTGDLQSGISLLRTAIESDATRWRLSDFDVRQTLPPADLAHGREQFRQLSRDRPRLLEHSESAGFDKLVTWVTRRFAGEGLGFTVDWDNAPPRVGRFQFIAAHKGPHWGARARIRISEVYPSGPRAGQQVPGDELWAALVFELFNLSNGKAFARLIEQSLAGNLSRAEYASESFLLEHRAVHLTQEFYCSRYLPWARSAGVPIKPKVWYVCDSAWWESAEETLDRYPFASDYPWAYYGERFDRLRRRPDAMPRKLRPSAASWAEAAEFATQAADAIRRGDLEAGLSKLRKAIEGRDSREGIVPAAEDKAVLSDEALEHGREQFRRLTRDRPTLLQNAEKPGFDRLRGWVIRRFGGEGSETTLDWDNAQPRSAIFGHVMEHTLPEDDTRGSVRIAAVCPTGPQAGKPIPFERMWSSLVIVLYNSSTAGEFNRVKRQAHRGELSSAEYVTEMFHLNVRATRLTQEFYADYYLPWAIGAQIPSDPDLWYMSDKGWWEDAQELLERFPFSSDYPWALYGRHFDHIRKSPGAQPRKPSGRFQQQGVTSTTVNPIKPAEHGPEQTPVRQ